MQDTGFTCILVLLANSERGAITFANSIHLVSLATMRYYHSEIDDLPAPIDLIWWTFKLST